MKRSDIVKIERTLARFQEGDLYTPVDTSGVGEYHAIAVRLETLRLSMLKIKDKVAETERRTSVSISSVAHDMKTPLAIISGYAECLSDGLDDKDYPALIAQKTEQMNEMVVGMVEAARNAKSDGEEHRALYDARVLFGNILDKQQSLVATKNIKLKVGKIPNVNIRADRTKIESVVQNLVSNAVKYSKENTTIKVTFRRNGGFLCFCVKDEGVGIAKENLPLVFDQYFKEDTSRPSGVSQGVGLYVAKCVGNDGKAGTYTSENAYGNIVVDGFGMLTVNGESVAYTLDGNNVTFVADNAMRVITLGDGTYTKALDGYQDTYTLPDESTITLDGYGNVTGTTKTYVVSGSNVTIYDGETSTTYGLDVENKAFLGKSVFAGLTYRYGTKVYDYIKFDDGVDISGEMGMGANNWITKFKDGVINGNELTVTVVSCNCGGISAGQTIVFTIDGDTLTIKSGKFNSNAVDVAVGYSYTLEK